MRASNWIEDFVFPMAVAALAAAWVHSWLVWISRAGLPLVDYPPVSAFVLGTLLMGAALLTRAVLDRSGSLEGARLLIAGAGLAAIAGSLWWTYRFAGFGAFLAALGDWGQIVSPVLAAVVACAFMWWQGIQMAATTWPQQHLERTFYLGIAGLALLFVANQSRPVITPGEAITTAVAVFGAGLGALALVSFENARRFHEDTTGTRLPLNRYWLATVATVIGLILAAGLAAASLFSPSAYAGLSLALRTLLDGLTFVVVFVVAALTALIVAIVFPLMQALMHFGEPGQPDEIIPFSPGAVASEQAESAVRLFADYPALAAGRQVVFLVLLVALIGLVLWWSVRRLGALGRKDGDEVRDSIATRELVLNQLKSAFRRRAAAAVAVDPYLALAGSEDDPRLMIRRAYQAMLAWAHTVARARSAGQTPASYAEALARVVPQGRAAIDTLTVAYERARYAAEPPTLAEARDAQGALNEIQALASRGGGQP